MKRKNAPLFTLVLLLTLLSNPKPAYALSSCTLNPVLSSFIIIITISILFFLFYFPFRLITRIKSQKNYPKLFSINRYIFSLIFLIPPAFPFIMIYINNILDKIIPNFNYEIFYGIYYQDSFIPYSYLIPILLSSIFLIFAIWIWRKYGINWGAKMTFVALGATIIYFIYTFAGDFGEFDHMGIYGSIEAPIKSIFPSQCIGGLPEF